MTIDLEDWAQAVLDPELPVTEHVLANTERVLNLLDRHGIKATFFALGKVCEKFASLLPDIASAGHEIASHGYGHQLVYRLTPEQFKQDVRRSIQIIEAQTGKRPVGYRAPAFSITRRSLWAGQILAKLDFEYSSSVFPIYKQRYGIPDWPAVPSLWPEQHVGGRKLIEFPLTTWSVLGQRFPACGGGYMRLLPACVHARAIARRNQTGYPAVIYLHPYELACDEVGKFRQAGFSFGARRRIMQSLWRSRVEPRLRVIFDSFQFGTMSDCLAAAAADLQPAALTINSILQLSLEGDRRAAAPA